MPKVGILYVCTGKYDIFWPDFYETAEMLLLPDCEKTYLVLTDAQKLPKRREGERQKVRAAPSRMAESDLAPLPHVSEHRT